MKFQQLLLKIRKENVTEGRTDTRTDNVKTVYPSQTKFAGGIMNSAVHDRLMDNMRLLTFKRCGFISRTISIYDI